MRTTIFMADDHAILRDGLRLLLETQPNLNVIGEAANGRDAVREATFYHPDIVIMDITMPDLNGIEAMQQIQEICPTTRVIILSMHGTTKHILRAFQAGANGYLLKESASTEVIKAVHKVCAGQCYLSQKISDPTIIDYLRQPETNETEDLLAVLSSREREVLQLVVEGKSSAEIANLLCLSINTVKTYRSRLMQKLNLNDLPSLVKFAVQYGLTPPE
jgi:DNA-binding NarL/FixJ family response regulator